MRLSTATQVFSSKSILAVTDLGRGILSTAVIDNVVMRVTIPPNQFQSFLTVGPESMDW